MDTNKDELIARIQKLLALSENNSNEHESRVAAAKAQAMLTEFNLSLDDVNTPAAAARQAIVLRQVDYPNGDEVWERGLHSSIARAFYCQPVRQSREGVACFIGRVTNADVASFVFEQVARRLPQLAAAAFKAYTQEWKAEHGCSFWTNNRNIPAIKGNFVRNWLLGAVSGLYEQLMAQQAEQERGLVVSTRQENAEATAQMFGRLGAARKIHGPEHNTNAYNNGVAAGRSLNIAAGLSSDAPRRQIK